jgi:hypothetical protein
MKHFEENVHDVLELELAEELKMVLSLIFYVKIVKVLQKDSSIELFLMDPFKALILKYLLNTVCIFLKTHLLIILIFINLF